MKKKVHNPEKEEIIKAGRFNSFLRQVHHRLVKQHWLYSRWGIGLLILLIVLVFSFPSGLGVKAAESRVYPSYCLGGWQNPQNAGGQPSLDQQAPASDFDSANSAVLKDTLADMFCGYFQSETHDNPPTKAVLMFSWNIDATDQIQPIAPDPQPDSIPAPEPAESTPEAPIATPPEPTDLGAPVQAQFAHSEPLQLAATDENPTPAPEIVPEPTPAPEPIQIEPLPVIEPTPEPTPEPITIDPAPAPSIEAPHDSGFLEVEYSFDGLNWKSLGWVTMNNWRSFQPAIPVTSWEQINSLQVVLSARSTFDQQPTVTLDGMWLETQYNPTFVEAIEDLGDQTNEFLSDLVNTTGDSLTELNDALTPGDQEAQVPNDQATEVLPSDEAVAPAPAPIEPPAPSLIAKRHLLFSSAGTAIPTTAILPWYSREDLKVLKLDEKAPQTISQAPAIEASVSGKSMIISGSCTADRYVVLLYKNADDYRQNPGAYAVNIAKPCVGGAFQFDLITIPDTLSVGTYYLMIGAQGAEGPWKPASALVPITIGSKIEEEQQ